MKLLNRCGSGLLALSICAPVRSAPAPAGAPTWTEGVNYFLDQPARPTSVPPGKVEVTEVFSYACPACNIFLPTMHKLKASPAAECGARLPAGGIQYRARTGRCFNSPTSPRKLWVSRIRPTMPCSTRCGRAAIWPSSTRDPRPQEPHADHRGCREVLQANSRRARRQIPRHLEVLLGGSQSAGGGGPDAGVSASIAHRPSSSTASIDCTVEFGGRPRPADRTGQISGRQGKQVALGRRGHEKSLPRAPAAVDLSGGRAAAFFLSAARMVRLEPRAGVLELRASCCFSA